VPEGRDFVAAQGVPVEVSPERAGEAADAAFVSGRFASSVLRDPGAGQSRSCSGSLRAYRGAALTLCIDDDVVRDMRAASYHYHPWTSAGGLPGAAERELSTGACIQSGRSGVLSMRPGAAPERKVSRVLLTMGGEDPGNHTLKVIEAASGRLAGLEVDIVIGPSHPDPTSVEQQQHAVCRRRSCTAHRAGSGN